MIQIEQVSKHYSKGHVQIDALTNVSLTIKDREIIGIAGKSGSGKSTLLRLLNLMEQSNEGRIMMDGQDIQLLSRQQKLHLKQKIGLVFQQFNLLANRTVIENVQLPLKLAGQRDVSRVLELIDFVGLKDKAGIYPRLLSGGQKQRVAIARALVNRPSILLCDEPTSALDEQHTIEIIQLLKQIHQTYQPTIIFVSHEIEVIQQLCQRVAVLEKGQLMGIIENTPKEIEQSQVTYYQHVIERMRQ